MSTILGQSPQASRQATLGLCNVVPTKIHASGELTVQSDEKNKGLARRIATRDRPQHKKVPFIIGPGGPRGSPPHVSPRS